MPERTLPRLGDGDIGTDLDLGIPPREWIRWRIVAFTEGAVFLGLLFLAIFLNPVWLGALVLILGMFASGVVWILAADAWRKRHPRARRLPKGASKP